MKFINLVYTIFFLLIIGVIFKNWFLGEAIIGGDWPYYYQETLQEFTFFPVTWNPEFNNGLGGIDSVYFLNTFQNFTVLLSQMFDIPWVIVYKIFWFGFFIALSVISTITLLKITIPNAKYWQLLTGATVFVSNTYILMVVGGGQMGVALAYSVGPLVLASFIKLVHSVFFSNIKFQISNFKYQIIASLVLALQVMFDPRISYITMIIIGLYFIFNFSIKPLRTITFLHSILFIFIVPGIIAAFIHAAWILPWLLFKQDPISSLGQSYTGSGIIKFLSFADFSNALSMLHPNWPENIFGKTYFMRSEFILIPILAFSGLLFLGKKSQNYKEHYTILFFVILGLLGAFLTKGANELFGGIYIWLFDHIPGFVLFRDPTKFYLMIALAYCVLIPFFLDQLKSWIVKRKTSFQNLSFMIPIIFLLLWMYLIRQSVLGKLGGTFAIRDVPKEYFQFKDYLHNQSEFYRTLWVPRRDRFSYYTNNHLAVESEPLFDTKNLRKLSEILNSKSGKDYLSALGVKYVIVPLDPYGEVFVKDRKYDPKEHKKTIRLLEATPWLTKLPSFKKIAVFKTKNAKDRFSLTKDGSISIKTISPTKYIVDASIREPQELIFSESYNPSWVAISDTSTVVSEKTLYGINSFPLNNVGNYSIKINFTQEKYYKYGQVISVIAILSTFIILFALKKNISNGKIK